MQGSFYFFLIMDRVLVAIFGIPLGLIIMIYRFQLTQFSGKIQWAEQYLGSGGTYNFYIIAGLAVSVLSLMYSLGTIQSFFTGTLGTIFGVR